MTSLNGAAIISIEASGHVQSSREMAHATGRCSQGLPKKGGAGK